MKMNIKEYINISVVPKIRMMENAQYNYVNIRSVDNADVFSIAWYTTLMQVTASKK